MADKISENVRIAPQTDDGKGSAPVGPEIVGSTSAQPAASPRPSETPAAVGTAHGGSRSGWLAAFLVIGLVGWMGSGLIWPSEPAKAPVAARTGQEDAKRVTVAVQSSQAEIVRQYLVSEGQALPVRLSQIRASAEGSVEALEARKGDYVEAGTVIARLEPEDRAAIRDQARAELERRRRDFDAVESLAERGYATKARLEEARAALASADAQVAAAGESLKDIVIQAPFSGVLDDLMIEKGEFVASGKDIGVIVDVDPLVIEIQIPQQSVSKVRAGMEAEISFITGEKRGGTVRYVSANANASTRTFAAEIEVPNPDRTIPAGISAQARIPIGQTPAHFVSPAVLSLGSDGALGVKIVENEDVVKFYPVELVRAETKGIWITGLPDAARIISVGQGFVSDGETVITSEADPQTPEAVASPAAAQHALGSDPESPEANHSGSVLGEAQAETLSAPRTAEIVNGPAAVERVQRGLAALGFYDGAANGILNVATRDAIQAFQTSRNVEPDGSLDADLLELLQTVSKERE